MADLEQLKTEVRERYSYDSAVRTGRSDSG